MSHQPTGDRKPTSIRVYEDEKEILKRAKRRVERDMDEDLPLHTALTMICESFLDASSTETDD